MISEKTFTTFVVLGLAIGVLSFVFGIGLIGYSLALLANQ